MRSRLRKQDPLQQRFLSEFIEKSIRCGAFNPGIGFDHLVIRDKWKDLLDEIILEWRREDDWLSVTEGSYPHGSLKRSVVQPDWRYASHNFKRLWVSHARRDNDTRAMTLWVGRSLIDDCMKRKEAIAPRIRKRMNDKLRRHLGTAQYDVWFDVEAMRNDPLDIHIHGLFELYDVSLWDKKSELKKIRQCLRESVGTDTKRSSNTQLRLEKFHNAGWLDYSGKQRRQVAKSRLKVPVSHVHPDIFGTLHASTRRIKQRAAFVYGQARKIINAGLSDTLADWTDDQWRENLETPLDHFD